ncbi:MAG: hypothetical protein EXR52_07955 [Dehalococcoidia bacterium]|nr:hypothetical protein [Dehalococcoidia bacterium]
MQNATSIVVTAKDPAAKPATVAQSPAVVQPPAVAASQPLSPRPVVRRTLDGLDDGGEPTPQVTPTPSPASPATPALPSFNPPVFATPLPTPAPTATSSGACDRSGVWEIATSPFTLSVSPACDTEYELTATNAGGTVVQTVLVKVTPIRINVFTSSPLSIPLGGEATLSWSVDGASILELSPLGAVTGESNRVVKPEATTDYVLTAYGRDRLGPSESRTVRVTVGLAPPKIDLFAATPPTVLLGQGANLTFSAQNVRRVTIAASDGTTVFDQTGQPSVQRSISISPSQATVYTLTVNNDSGSATAAVVVTVLPLPTATPTLAAPPARAPRASPVAVSLRPPLAHQTSPRLQPRPSRPHRPPRRPPPIPWPPSPLVPTPPAGGLPARG